MDGENSFLRQAEVAAKIHSFHIEAARVFEEGGRLALAEWINEQPQQRQARKNAAFPYMYGATRVQDAITVECSADMFSRFLRAVLGPAELPEKPQEAQRWEDDGGPPIVAFEGYTHSIEAVA